MSFKLPKLYNLSKSGKEQFWLTYVIDNKDYSSLYVNYGFVGGKETLSERKIYIGKNLNKKNETSPYDQAISIAESKWNNKKKLNYKDNLKDIYNKTDDIVLPMLALNFETRGEDIIYPCYVQPKLDGIRAVLVNKKLQSRTGKIFPNLGHITDELNKYTADIFDGELYSNTLNFQQITGLVQKKTLNSEDLKNIKQIIFIVYDVILPIDYKERYDILYNFFIKNKLKYISLNKTEICTDISKIQTFLIKYIQQGYEGLIIRNYLGSYIKKHRSKNLQKLKLFKDDEYIITSFEEGSGKEKGLVIWICETSEGKTFKVRPKGTYEERAELFENGHKYMGKLLTVKYFEMTDDNIPRFPVGLQIRDYE